MTVESILERQYISERPCNRNETYRNPIYSVDEVAIIYDPVTPTLPSQHTTISDGVSDWLKKPAPGANMNCVIFILISAVLIFLLKLAFDRIDDLLEPLQREIH